MKKIQPVYIGSRKINLFSSRNRDTSVETMICLQKKAIVTKDIKETLLMKRNSKK